MDGPKENAASKLQNSTINNVNNHHWNTSGDEENDEDAIVYVKATKTTSKANNNQDNDDAQQYVIAEIVDWRFTVTISKSKPTATSVQQGIHTHPSSRYPTLYLLGELEFSRCRRSHVGRRVCRPGNGWQNGLGLLEKKKCAANHVFTQKMTAEEATWISYWGYGVMSNVHFRSQ